MLTYLIANDEDEGGQATDDMETVVDVVEAMRLVEISLDKKSFMGYIKGKTLFGIKRRGVEYLKKVKAKMEEQGKKDRIPEFQKGATEFVKLIVSKIDEVQFFTGEQNDYEGGLGYCYMREQTDDGPTFFFFADGMYEEKY